MDTSGFYKQEGNGNWLFAPNFVISKNYELKRDGDKQSKDGWEWFDEAPAECLTWLEQQDNG